MKKRQILNGKSSNLKWKVVKSEMSPYQNLNENRHQLMNWMLRIGLKALESKALDWINCTKLSVVIIFAFIIEMYLKIQASETPIKLAEQSSPVLHKHWLAAGRVRSGGHLDSHRLSTAVNHRRTGATDSFSNLFSFHWPVVLDSSTFTYTYCCLTTASTIWLKNS